MFFTYSPGWVHMKASTVIDKAFFDKFDTELRVIT